MLIGNLIITDSSVFEKAAMDFATKNIKFAGTISEDVKAQIADLILKALLNSPTVQDLMFGELKHDLGLMHSEVSTVIDSIVKYIIDSMEIKMPAKGKKSLPKIDLKLSAGDIGKLIKAPGASFQSKGGNVNWLEWLLTKGSQVIIKDHWVFSHAKGKTRSGGPKVMVEISKKAREPFRIDPKHSGTVSNNFITRALDTVKDDISALVMSSMMGI